MNVQELINKLLKLPPETPVTQWTSSDEAPVEIIYIHKEQDKVISVVIGGDYV